MGEGLWISTDMSTVVAPPKIGSNERLTATLALSLLVHGMLGFEAIGPVNYFYGVPSSLRSSGATVFTPAVSALK